MTQPPPAELDLTSYRSEDLVAHLVDVVSVPGAVRKVLSTAAVATVLAAIACGLLRGMADLALLPWLAISVYALVACVVLGFALGLLRVVRSALAGVQGVLETSLDITTRAARDYQQLGAGRMKLPPGEQLFAQVHEQVLLPSLERAVSRSFGPLSTPLLWLYRRTLGSAVNWVIRRTARDPRVEQQHALVQQITQSSLGTLAGYAEAVATFTTAASDKVERVGDRLRFYAMLPLWIALTAATLLAALPLVIYLCIFA